MSELMHISGLNEAGRASREACCDCMCALGGTAVQEVVAEERREGLIRKIGDWFTFYFIGERWRPGDPCEIRIAYGDTYAPVVNEDARRYMKRYQVTSYDSCMTFE